MLMDNIERDGFQSKTGQNVNKSVYFFVNSFHLNIAIFLEAGLPKDFSAILFTWWMLFQ